MDTFIENTEELEEFDDFKDFEDSAAKSSFVLFAGAFFECVIFCTSRPLLVMCDISHTQKAGQVLVDEKLHM